jgi:hypothetical protein
MGKLVPGAVPVLGAFERQRGEVGGLRVIVAGLAAGLDGLDQLGVLPGLVQALRGRLLQQIRHGRRLHRGGQGDERASQSRSE